MVLVVASLLDGISCGDKVSDLDSRLRELLVELDALFTKNLESLPPRDQSQASQLFQIERAWGGGLGTTDLSFVDDPGERLYSVNAILLQTPERKGAQNAIPQAKE